MIRIVPFQEQRKKVDIPDWSKAVGDYSDDQIAAAIDKANALPGSVADPNMVQVVWPVLVMPITAAALDFGNVTQITVKLGELIAAQTWIKRDRLIKHIQSPGTRADDKDSPFVSLPIVAEGNIIVDGHHTLTALWLLAGSDLQVPVWCIPIGIATGHPR